MRRHVAGHEARTETLAETQGDGVKGVAQLLDRSARLGRDVPYARTVEVHLEVIFARKLGDTDDLVLREYGAIQGVFKRDDLDRCTGSIIRNLVKAEA